MLNPALVKIREGLAQVPYIARIDNQDDFELGKVRTSP